MLAVLAWHWEDLELLLCDQCDSETQHKLRGLVEHLTRTPKTPLSVLPTANCELCGELFIIPTAHRTTSPAQAPPNGNSQTTPAPTAPHHTPTAPHHTPTASSPRKLGFA